MSFPGQSGFDASTGPAERRDFFDLRRRVSALEENSDNGGGGDSGGGEGGGIPEAPLDGQQYGRQDAAWSVIELDDGEHVLTGDPENPPAELDAGQLLWDGVEGGSGSGGGGPHDHDEYLPLTGGTVTGDLQVDGQTLASRGSGTAPGLSFANYRGTGFYPGSNNVATHVNGAWQFVVYEDKTRVIRDLQVDGNSDLKINTPADFWQANASGTVFHAWGMGSGTQGSYSTSMTSNGYRNTGGKWTSMGVNGEVGAAEISLTPSGRFYVRVSPNCPTGSASSPPIRFTVTDAGSTLR